MLPEGGYPYIMSSSAEPDFDFSGLKCPLPVLKTRRCLKEIAAGAVITVRADDPAAPLDMAHFCETEGHLLVASLQEAESFVFTIRKSG